MSKIYNVIISVGEVYQIEADSEEQAENFLRNGLNLKTPYQRMPDWNSIYTEDNTNE